MSEEDLAAFMAKHPRMTSILFAALILLTQVGAAAAENGQTYTGP
jgi:hypothetical protein